RGGYPVPAGGRAAQADGVRVEPALPGPDSPVRGAVGAGAAAAARLGRTGYAGAAGAGARGNAGVVARGRRAGGAPPRGRRPRMTAAGYMENGRRGQTRLKEGCESESYRNRAS